MNKCAAEEQFGVVGLIEHGSRGDFTYLRQELLRLKSGSFVLRGEGGEYTEYGRRVGYQKLAPGKGSQRLTPEQAREWAKKNLSSDKFKELFGAHDGEVAAE